jgi:hypothetical protein
MLLLVFTCNLCISGQQSDLFTLLVLFLVSAALQKKCIYLIRTLVLHRTSHHERGVFCKFLLHIFKVLLMNRAVFFRLLYLFTDCLSSLYISAALQKKCTNINNGVILVPYNKSRLKQTISVMLNSFIFLYLIRTLVLHRTFHHERGVFCKFLLHIFEVLLI